MGNTPDVAHVPRRGACADVIATLIAPLIATFALAAHAGPENLKSCEVQAGCKVFVAQSSDCEAVTAWVGRCERGYAQGTGALHFIHGTALVGRHTDGRSVGAVVWHENGIPKGIGEYETHLVSLDSSGTLQGQVASCSWDFTRDKVASLAGKDKRCEEAAKDLGQFAFSPEVWRAYAKQAGKGRHSAMVGALSPVAAKRLP
jgi:hypothetical protein